MRTTADTYQKKTKKVKMNYLEIGKHFGIILNDNISNQFLRAQHINNNLKKKNQRHKQSQ